ncbi:MAG: LamG-like jellyroll fold domain-containing protein [Candidatus Paceibacterota bacterium]|jgi:prepilin-type N-terminal cleavage/methylation domain-containing protein
MRNKAFTLIELLVVIAIVGILSSVIYTNITGLRDRARITAAQRFDSSTLHSIGDQLVGEWTFDSPLVGGLTPDTSGFNNHGTISGATYATTSGFDGKGTYYFDGNDYIDVGDPSVLDITGAITITAWFKTSNTSNQILMGKSHTSSYYINQTIFWTNGVSLVASGPSYIDDKWHLMAATLDSDGKRSVYVDGVLRGSASGGSLTTDNYHVRIGDSGNAHAPFIGYIDNVRIYSSALSGAEIQKLYAEEGVVRI